MEEGVIRVPELPMESPLHQVVPALRSEPPESLPPQALHFAAAGDHLRAEQHLFLPTDFSLAQFPLNREGAIP